MFALASRSVRAIASPTSSGTWLPPGASRKTKSPCSDEKRRRAGATAIVVVLTVRSYSMLLVQTRALGGSGIEVSRLVLGCGNFGGIGSAPAFFGQGETRE